MKETSPEKILISAEILYPYKYIQTSGLNISVNDTTVYTPQTPDVTPGR